MGFRKYGSHRPTEPIVEWVINRYVCLGSDVDQNIPTHSLDGLFAGQLTKNRPMLIRCDVGGAELLVLEGARKVMLEASPVLLLSVHPEALPNYGHSVEILKQYLTGLGYEWKLIEVDHEEHWWCERSQLK